MSWLIGIALAGALLLPFILLVWHLYSIDHAVDRIEKLIREQNKLLELWHSVWQERKP